MNGVRKLLAKLFFWIKCARYQSFAQSFLPAVLAFTVIVTKKEYSLHSLDVLLGVFALVGVILAHSSANLFDDFFDYTSQAVKKRREMVDGGIRARSLKCSYLDMGLTSVKHLLYVAIAFGLVATSLGGVILYYRGLPIVICFLIGVVLAFFYSAPPFKFSYHGLGEIIVGLLFGPVVMSGISYSVCGKLDPSVIFLSIPMGILAANILYVHSILDLEPDKRAGKYTLAALIGSQKSAVRFGGLLLLACYAVVIIGVLLKYLNVTTLLVLCSAPLAFELYRVMNLYLKDPGKKIQRKFYHGPMECWDMINKAGIDWFMFRWYLARNLLTIFAICLFISIGVDCFLHSLSPC